MKSECGTYYHSSINLYFPVMCDLYLAGPRVQLHLSHQEPKGEEVVAGLCSGRCRPDVWNDQAELE